MPISAARLTLVSEGGGSATVGDLGGKAFRYVRIRRDAREWAPTTCRDNRYILERFVRLYPDLDLKRVRRKHIEKWMSSRDISASSVARELSVVRTFFRWSLDRGWITNDPTRGITGPKRPEDPPRNLPGADITRLLTAVPDARARLICLLMVQEGLRRAEVAGLLVENLDVTNRLLRVRGKGGRVRELPYSDETAEAIRAYVSEYPTRLGPLIRSYTHPRDGLTPPAVGMLVSGWMRDAGIKVHAYDGRSGHALRHSAASDMLDHGADPRDVQEFLGHQDLSTTDRYLKRQRAATKLRKAASGRSYLSPPPEAA